MTLDDEEQLEGQNFRDVLLNGDEKGNRFVKMVDTRFLSAARRQNKARQEVREEFITLRTELAPLLAVARVVYTMQQIAPVAGVITGALGVIVTSIVALGVWP